MVTQAVHESGIFLSGPLDLGLLLDAPACFYFAVHLPRPSTAWSFLFTVFIDHFYGREPMKAKA